jgi:hypothetical protein
MRGLSKEMDDWAVRKYAEHKVLAEYMAVIQEGIEESEADIERAHAVYLSGEPMTIAERMKAIMYVGYRDLYYDEHIRTNKDIIRNLQYIDDAMYFEPGFFPQIVGQAVMDAAKDGVVISINEEDFHGNL